MTTTDRTDQHGFVLIMGGKAGAHPLDERRGLSPHLTVTPDRGSIRCNDCGVPVGRGKAHTQAGGYAENGHRICLPCFHRRLGG